MSQYFWTSISSNDPTVGANWTKSDGTTGTAPTTGDDAVVQGVPGSTLANINAADMHTVTLATLTVNIPPGGPTIGGAGNGGYWRIAASIANVTGGGRIKIDFGTVQTTCTGNANGASADAGQEAIRFLGTHASNVFNITGGPVGIATNQPFELATAATINAVGGTCNTGAGVTVGSVNVANNGAYNGNSALSGTLTTDRTSTATINGSGTIATVMNLGTVKPNTTGTITTFDNYGKYDWSASSAPRTVTTLNVHPGSQIINNAANPAALTITTRNLKNISIESYT